MSHTADQLLNIIEDKILETRASQQADHGLYLPIHYILEDGGKRIRPMLTMLAAQIYNAPLDRALGAAIAIEVFHNFTLLHDDIMDKAPLRRGRPTAHLRWGESRAILSGDAMVIEAYRLLSQSADAEHLVKLLDVFNRAAREVCEGQQLDMEFEESSREITIEQYTEMIRLKTSVLLAAALEMGAITGGAPRDEAQALYRFGIDLGLAFQLQDDLLDTYGDQASFGKTIGGDIAVGKKTFLQITAIKSADPEQRRELSSPTEPSRESNIEKYSRVKAIYDAHGVREQTERAISHYFDRAIATLRAMPIDANLKIPLTDYANWLLGRVK